MAAKESKILITELQKLILSNRKIDESALQKIGIDPSLKSQEYRNVKITYDFWNGLTVSIIDNLKDLDGNPIAENKKLISRVKNLLENGTTKIKVDELLDLKIWNSAKEIILGNIVIKNYSDFFVSYDHCEIQIINAKKNIDGLWRDNAITTDRILEVLHKFDLTAKRLSKMRELELNKELEVHFKQYFETVKKGGRSNQGDIDLILGSNHNYGIEIKLAKELAKASNCQKAIGQIELYTRQFEGNFMLIVAGLASEKNDKAVSEVVKKAKNCKSSYYYLETE